MGFSIDFVSDVGRNEMQKSDDENAMMNFIWRKSKSFSRLSTFSILDMRAWMIRKSLQKNALNRFLPARKKKVSSYLDYSHFLSKLINIILKNERCHDHDDLEDAAVRRLDA